MENFILDATCAVTLWDQGHREGTVCARENVVPSQPLAVFWGHFHGTGAAQHPLCQTAMTQVGNKVKNRDQHLGGALSGQDFPLRKRAAKDAVSKNPNSLVWIRAPLTATSSVKLSPVGIRERYSGRKGAPSSHFGSKKQQQSCADMQPPSHATSWEPSLLGAAH